MSKEKKIFKYVAEYSLHLKTFIAKDSGEYFQLSINDFRPREWESKDTTLRMLVPKEEIPAFIEFLQEIVKDET